MAMHACVVNLPFGHACILAMLVIVSKSIIVIETTMYMKCDKLHDCTGPAGSVKPASWQLYNVVLDHVSMTPMTICVCVCKYNMFVCTIVLLLL